VRPQCRRLAICIVRGKVVLYAMERKAGRRINDSGRRKDSEWI